MSAPNDHGQGQPPFQQQYDGQPYEAPIASPPPSAGQPPVDAGGKKKKRAYAAGAFDVGTGGNAAAGGQLPAGGQFGAPQPIAPGYGGAAYLGQEQQQQQPAGYPSPQQFQPAGAPGFEQPAAGYGAPQQPAYGVSPAPGVGGITQGMANMQMGGGAQPAPQQQQPQGRAGPLNQLYPTDLMNQPFNVSELDLPPPPIILPPNVSQQILSIHRVQRLTSVTPKPNSPAVRLPRRPTAHPNMCDPPSTPSQRRTPSSRSRSSPSPSSSSRTRHSMTWMTLCQWSRTRSFRVAGGAGHTSTLT